MIAVEQQPTETKSSQRVWAGTIDLLWCNTETTNTTASKFIHSFIHSFVCWFVRLSDGWRRSRFLNRNRRRCIRLELWWESKLEVPSTGQGAGTPQKSVRLPDLTVFPISEILLNNPESRCVPRNFDLIGFRCWSCRAPSV